MKSVQTNYLAVLVLSILLFSCTNENKQSNGSSGTNGDLAVTIPQFQEETVTKSWNDCNDYPGKACVDVKINYPKLANNDYPNLTESVKDYVLQFTADFIATEKPLNQDNLKEYITLSINEQVKMVQESDETYEPIFQLQINIEPVYSNEKITTLHSRYNSYMGGAHPNHGAGYIILENASGKILNENIVAKDMEMKQLMLNELKARQNAPNQDISEIGYLVTDLEFAVSDNIGVSKDSLFVTYSPYEIAPYSMGFQNFAYAKEEVREYLATSFVEKWNE